MDYQLAEGDVQTVQEDEKMKEGEMTEKYISIEREVFDAMKEENASLKKRVEELEHAHKLRDESFNKERERAEKAEADLANMTKAMETWRDAYERRTDDFQQLKEAVERHRIISMKECNYWCPWDIELYKVLEEVKE